MHQSINLATHRIEPDKSVTQIDKNIRRGTEAAGWGDEAWCWCLGNCRGAVTGEER